MRAGSGRAAWAAALLACAACRSAESWAAAADAEVLPIVSGTQQGVLGDRERTALRPALEADADEDVATGTRTPGEQTAAGAPADAAPLELDLAGALGIAFSTSREFQSRGEGLYLAGLSLSLTRYQFGPVLDSTIAFLWGDEEHGASASSLAGSLGVSQVLPEGGTVGLTGSLSRAVVGGPAAPGSDDPLWASGLTATLSQPLLRGAGNLVSHESLTQAERNMVYAVRDFELFREDFAISIAADYFNLVRQQRRLVVLRQNLADAEFDRHKADALRKVDRNQDEDVFLARRRFINAESELLQAEADNAQFLDAFKVRLGLPGSARVTIVDADPPFLPIRLDPDSAVTVALANRLDLHTVADRVKDAERGVAIARDGLRPDLALSLSAGFGETGGSVGSALADEWVASAGLTLGLPVDRQSERNDYRASRIELDQARRDEELARENVEREVRNQIRQLRRTEDQIVLQTEQIEQDRRAVVVTQIRYENGEAENRDLLDARQSLTDAQNALIDLGAAHFIGRLTLMRSVGILFIDEKGTWIE